jgi:hypothetical protein
MTTKKPSVATQLRTAKADVERLTAALAKAVQEKDSSASTRDYYGKKNDSLQKELEELHALLDTFEGVVPRKSTGEWSAVEYSAMTRLASWLANRSK